MAFDNIDELLKKKQLDALNQQIGQGAQVEDQGTQDLQPRPVPAEPVTTQSVEQVDAPSEGMRMPANQARMIADTVAGATPALLSFLGGASPSVTNMQFDKMNAYAKTRGTQDIPTKQNTVNLDDGTGKPVISMMSDAVGKQPWVKPAVGRDKQGNSAKAFELHKAYSEELGKNFTVQFNKDTGEIKGPSGELIKVPKDIIINPVAEKIVQAETPGGGKVIDSYNQYNTGAQKPAVKGVMSMPGRGELAGKITKEEYDAMMHGAQKGRDEAAPIKMKLAELDAISRDPNALKNPAVFSANYGRAIRAIVGENRLSDDEQDKFEGGKYKTLLQTGYNVLDGKFNGEIPQNVIQDFLALQDSAKMKLNAQYRSVSDSYVNPGVVKNQATRDAQIRASGQDPKKVTNTAKAELIEFEKQAAARYGKGSEQYNKAMAFKKDKLGL